MRVKLMRTFEADVGEFYGCELCSRRGVLGWVEPVLVTEDEAPIGHKRPPTEEQHEVDQKRNEHYAARVTDLDGAPRELGLLCPECIEGGADLIEDHIRSQIRLLESQAHELERALAEGVSDVPTLEEVELASEYYRSPSL